VSEFFEKVHRDAGVKLLTNAAVTALRGNPVNQVELADGQLLDADFVVVGIGLIATSAK
jgi:3-phenylpropionate/trans-cinnamate dioxygenase ferredoxin reductase subunit